jgi:hypothetical protein
VPSPISARVLEPVRRPIPGRREKLSERVSEEGALDLGGEEVAAGEGPLELDGQVGDDLSGMALVGTVTLGASSVAIKAWVDDIDGRDPRRAGVTALVIRARPATRRARSGWVGNWFKTSRTSAWCRRAPKGPFQVRRLVRASRHRFDMRAWSAARSSRTR